MYKRLAAEVIGTFSLVFAGTGAIVINDVTGGTIGHAGIALTFGLVVLAMIYAVVPGQLQHLWVYIVAPIAGAMVAVPACLCVQSKGCCAQPPCSPVS